MSTRPFQVLVCITLITKLYHFMKVIKNYITHAVEVNVLVRILLSTLCNVACKNFSRQSYATSRHTWIDEKNVSSSSFLLEDFKVIGFISKIKIYVFACPIDAIFYSLYKQDINAKASLYISLCLWYAKFYKIKVKMSFKPSIN